MDNTITTLLCLKKYKNLGRGVLDLIFYHCNNIMAKIRLFNYLENNGIDVKEFNDMLLRNNAIIAGSTMLKCYTNNKFNARDIDIFVNNDIDLRENSIYKIITDKYNGVPSLSDSYSLIQNIHYSREFTFRNSPLIINVTYVNMDPREFVKNWFDIDCCKIMYDGVNVNISYDVYNGLRKGMSLCRIPPTCNTKNCYRSSPMIKFTPTCGGFREGALYKRYIKFCDEYTRYKKTFQWNYEYYPDITADMINKLEKIMEHVNYEDNKHIVITDYDLMLAFHLRYFSRLIKYKNRGINIYDTTYGIRVL